DGPAVSATYPLGTFREDYEWVAHPSDPSYLDAHNGRFCVTPEYPNGIYCYFATVDVNHNSVYPYLIGPTYYGNKTGAKVTTVSESTTTYNSTTSSIDQTAFENLTINVFPNPSTDFIAIQISGVVTDEVSLKLFDSNGKEVNQTKIYKGQTIGFFDTQVLYPGVYTVQISVGQYIETRKVVIK
ncbi:MAG TPA: YHYH protein, partial [Saprospiraceae bacterium]|nr:YHYH protein [Saprospiraceae bacterium]HMT71274.1 YHYH protein [Saprospiraceae bacterium]